MKLWPPLAKVQILNMATIAGNICTASPAADSVPASAGSRMQVVTLKSGLKGDREVLLKDFLLGLRGKPPSGPQESSVQRERSRAWPKEHESGEFKKMERVGSDIAKINMAVVVEKNGKVCESCKVAVGSCGPTTAMLIDGPDQLLSGKANQRRGEGELIRNSRRSRGCEGITPIDDIRSTAEYRRKVASVMFMDTFKALSGKEL